MGKLLWCPVCDTSHGNSSPCPGPLLATGDERPGWSANVETPMGLEAIGVLVAPTGDFWRARILTYPNVLWMVPGGRSSLKFVAASPQEAEKKAIEYIDAHCLERGWLRRDGVTAIEGVTVPAEAAPEAALVGSPAKRKSRALPVRYWAGANAVGALTANVSETGLFVATNAPLVRGTSLRLHVEFSDETRVPLRGLVVWNRERLEIGRPSGMGVHLFAPPSIYVRSVQALP